MSAEKVYCGDCRHFGESKEDYTPFVGKICIAKENRIFALSWLEPQSKYIPWKPEKHPSEINARNNCQWFEPK